MKKANQVVISFLLPGLLQIAGCRGTVGNPSEKVDVAFSILESDTRTTVTSGEGHVDLAAPCGRKLVGAARMAARAERADLWYNAQPCKMLMR